MALTSGSKILIDDVNDAVKAFSVSGTTVTFTRLDGTTGTFTSQDTTYSAGTGISISSNKITNSGVTSVNGSTGAVTISVAVPSGSIIAYAANTIPDGGFLLCNGAEVSRTTYATLFSIIGTTYGSGDGSTTFALPNLTDKFIQGSGTAGTVKAAGLPNIYGALNRAIGESAYSATSPNALSRGDGAEKGYSDSSSHPLKTLYINAKTYNSIYGNSTTVQPPALTMRFYIKY